MALPESTTMTEAEYLAFDRESLIKHEYINGEVFAMAGAGKNHNLICSYTIAALINLLVEKDCEVYPSDMRLKIEASKLYTYPDVTLVCGESQFVDGEFDTLLNPIIIVEILSPSTEHYDRGAKFHAYRKVPSLQEYLLISADTARIERFLRQDNSPDWLYTEVTGLDSHLALPSLNCTLELSDVYRKVMFEGE